MKYLLLITNDPNELATMAPDAMTEVFGEYFAFTQRIQASGEMLAGDPLHDISTATTLRIRDGETTLTDGPFAETKEHFAGFYVVDVVSLDRALELAAQIPGARTGSIEVRPIMSYPE